MAIVVKDSFNRANSTTSLGVAETGQTWVTDGVWGIENNQAKYIRDNSIAILNTGISDCIISVKNINKLEGSGLVFRTTGTDWDDGFDLQYRGSFISLFRMDSWAIIGEFPIQSYTTMKVELQGSSIKVYLDNVLKINITNTHNQTATRHGILTGTVGSTFDDFLIEDFNEEPPQGTKHTKSLVESIAITDSIINRSGSKRIIENVSITDSKTVKTSLSFVEPLDITDDITVTPPDLPNVYTKELIDAVAFNEIFTKSAYMDKVLNDAVISTESTAKSFEGFKLLSDSLNSNDSISKNFTIAILDQVNASEQNSGNVDRLINDTLNINDNLAQEGNNIAQLSDHILITDIISKALYKLQSDNINTGENNKGQTIKELLDDLVPNDSIIYNEGKAILLIDSIISSDSLQKAVHTLQNDFTLLSDTVNKQSNVSVSLCDVIVSTDVISVFNPNAPQYIGTIHLKGKRELYVYLIAKQSLYVELKAKRELYIHLKGGVNMTMVKQNFSMFAGDAKYIKFAIEGITDFSGSSIAWSMRRNKYSGESVLNKAASVDGAEAQIKLSPDDTAALAGTFYHECKLTDSLGNVSTVFVGAVTINRSAIK